jgi:hypothetical protein
MDNNQPNLRKIINSSNMHRKMRLKIFIWIRGIDFILLTFICLNIVGFVECNRPPRFLMDGQSEIVLRLKEGPETPVGELLILIYSPLFPRFMHFSL